MKIDFNEVGDKFYKTSDLSVYFCRASAPVQVSHWLLGTLSPYREQTQIPPAWEDSAAAAGVGLL